MRPIWNLLRRHSVGVTATAVVAVVALGELATATVTGASLVALLPALSAGVILIAVLLPRYQRAAEALAARSRDPALGSLLAEVRRALPAGEFELHFQPIARMASGEVEAAEALVRWRRSDGTLVSPAGFVPRIEMESVFWPLTLELIDQAVRQCARWARSGRAISVAVNISSATLIDERLPAELARVLGAHRVPARQLQLEVTEGAIMQDVAVAVRVLEALRELGVAVIAIDDFGTGYSSLGRLRDLPVNAVKLDRSFVAELGRSGEMTLVKPIMELAHGLGMAVTAEGIEDGETWRALAHLGCDHGQGFWIARPAPASDFTRWLEAHSAAPLAALSQWSERRQGAGRRADDLIAAALRSEDAVLVLDDHGNYHGGNRAAMQLWGHPLEALVHGTPLDAYLTPRQRDELKARLGLLKQEGRYEGDWELVLPDGRLHCCTVHATADVVPGRHVLILRSRPAPGESRRKRFEYRASRARV